MKCLNTFDLKLLWRIKVENKPWKSCLKLLSYDTKLVTSGQVSLKILINLYIKFNMIKMVHLQDHISFYSILIQIFGFNTCAFLFNYLVKVCYVSHYCENKNFNHFGKKVGKVFCWLCSWCPWHFPHYFQLSNKEKCVCSDFNILVVAVFSGTYIMLDTLHCVIFQIQETTTVLTMNEQHC